MDRVFPVTLLPGDKYKRIKRKEPQVRFISMVQHEDIYDIPAALRSSQLTINGSPKLVKPPVKETRSSNSELNVSPYWISNDPTLNSVQNLVIPPTPTAPEFDERDTWSSRVEFVLSCVGLSAGIGNVWRFPYLAYQNGGAAFLFAYIVLLILVGKPMYFMELAWGHFVQSGPVGAFSCSSLWKGVGYAMFVVSIIVCVYYNVIVAYCLLYLTNSFYGKLPWDGCDQWWLKDNSTCYDRSAGLRRCSELTDVLIEEPIEDNETLTRTRWVFQADNCTNSTIQTSAQLFWERQVLNISSGIEEVGEIKYDLLICLAIAWIICFCCIAKSIKTSGKVVYFTSTFPYVILICLLVRGVTLDGASMGLRYFFIPEWKALLNLGVWQKAAEQLFFSLGLSMGSLFVYGSFNKSGKNIAKDATLVSYVDFFTSLLASVVIFSVLGNMSYELGIPIDKVAQQGQGLAFVTYPEALSRLWVPQLWSFMFFFMLFLLGLDSEFASLEVVIVSITDKLPSTRKYKALVAFVICATCFALGILCVLNNGQYILNLMDTYGGGVSVIFISFFEMVALMWSYGFRNFTDDLEMTLGFRPSLFWQICWGFVAPVVLLFVCGWSLCDTSVVKYGDYEYPFYGKIIGWCLVFSSVGMIPLFALIELYKHRENPKSAFLPDATFVDQRAKMSKENSNRPSLFELHVDEKILDNASGSDYSLEDSFEDASLTAAETNEGESDSENYSVITLRSGARPVSPPHCPDCGKGQN